MTCSRCSGLMFREPVSSRRTWIWLWACYACGDRMDDTIWLHRSLRRQETKAEQHARLLREMQALIDTTLIAG